MLAAIDAGSNTLRLLIGKVQNGKVAPLLYERRICRLAGGPCAVHMGEQNARSAQNRIEASDDE